MAISAVFKNRKAAVDAREELDDLGFFVEAGRNTREIGHRTKGKEAVIKEEAQLIIEVTEDQSSRITEVIATLKDVVAKFEGRLVI
ncbi:MAG TPA: hypothetical protein VJ624_00985 [Thermodesulfobacteriota bacterium]|nr:hypothetical protein [Thermodesulfobacteriota bacterium]